MCCYLDCADYVELYVVLTTNPGIYQFFIQFSQWISDMSTSENWQLIRHMIHQSHRVFISCILVLVVQWFSVGLMIERLLVRLPARALSSQLGQLSLLSLRGR